MSIKNTMLVIQKTIQTQDHLDYHHSIHQFTKMLRFNTVFNLKLI